MQTSIILGEEEKQQLDKIAIQEDRTRSQLIRLAIRNLIKEKIQEGLKEENANK